MDSNRDGFMDLAEFVAFRCSNSEECREDATEAKLPVRAPHAHPRPCLPTPPHSSAPATLVYPHKSSLCRARLRWQRLRAPATLAIAAVLVPATFARVAALAPLHAGQARPRCSPALAQLRWAAGYSHVCGCARHVQCASWSQPSCLRMKNERTRESMERIKVREKKKPTFITQRHYCCVE